MFWANICVDLCLVDLIDCEKLYEPSELVFTVDVGQLIKDQIVDKVNELGPEDYIDNLIMFDREKGLSDEDDEAFMKAIDAKMVNLIENGNLCLYKTSFQPNSDGTYDVCATINLDLDKILDELGK